MKNSLNNGVSNDPVYKAKRILESRKSSLNDAAKQATDTKLKNLLLYYSFVQEQQASLVGGFVKLFIQKQWCTRTKYLFKQIDKSYIDNLINNLQAQIDLLEEIGRGYSE